jgi:DNA polymerase zeta
LDILGPSRNNAPPQTTTDALSCPAIIPSMETFRVRLNCIDHYQATPIDLDPPVPNGSSNRAVKDRPRVSVIRVFGATETGQKVLMHIHGAFQYCYIEYSGSLIEEEVNVAIKTLQLSLDHALALSYRKNPYEGNYQYVAHISLVKGIPFYGFHVGYKFYLKIYLLNPLHMTRLADLLREGAVMKRVLQPYESHMQYLAQWMCDYNLYGCAYIDCKKVKFRGPVPAYLELNSALHQWHDRSIPPEFISSEDVLPQQSNCSLEVDLCVWDILNREGVHARPLHHDFVERIHPIPADAKLVQSMAGLWKDETRRRKARLGLIDPSSSPFPPEVLVTMSADPRNSQPGGWIHEEEFRAKVDHIAQEEHDQNGGRKLTFNNFVGSVPFGSAIRTALESVEDLYPKNLPRGEEASVDVGNAVQAGMEAQNAMVDETRILQLRDAALDDPTGAETAPNGAQINGAESSNGTKSLNDAGDGSDTDATIPISSSEYERFGIRRAGDLSHVDEDAFQAPDEYILSESRSNGPKRELPDPLPSSSEPRRKKRKVLIDEKNLLPDVDTNLQMAPTEVETLATIDHRLAPTPEAQSEETAESDRNAASLSASQEGRSQANSQLRNSKLAFPVVKDPSDPNTIMRFSQHSNSSSKMSQGLQDKPIVTAFSSFHPITKSSGPSSQKSSTSPMTSRTLSPPPQIPKGMAESTPNLRTFVFAHTSPSFSEVQKTMPNEGLPDIIYQNAYYSDEADVPDRQREYAGREFKLESNTVPYLPNFDPIGTSLAAYGEKPPVLLDFESEEKEDRKRRRLCKISTWIIGEQPPSRAEVEAWARKEAILNNPSVLTRQRQAEHAKPLSQIDGPTQKNKHGFKYSQKHASTSVQHETQYMSIMSLEVHVDTRGNLAPNPEHDEIACVFWCVQSDDDDFETNGPQEGTHTGILVNDKSGVIAKNISRDVAVEVEAKPTELDVLTSMTDIVRQYDPDILTGYEVHNSSWGYLIERARVKYELNFCDEISRMKSQSHGRFGKEEDRWGFNQTSTIRVTGRHTINIWRAMRGELNLLQYTMENVVFHLLHRRIPHYKFADLNAWYTSKTPRDLSKVVEYFVSRVQIDLAILDANELVPRTSEQARLLGVDWFSVISRGSQFKVESLMFRIAKPENFILVSPSRRQVGGQNALECLPLVMEPQSDFYTSPLLVLDFQSLYPSVMIAYNYCYSTFLGRVVSWRGTNKMGFTNYRREQRLIELLKDHINIAPNGIMYCKPHIRKSLLAKMLGEILETRVMVKSGMKVDKDDKTLQRLLNNRQLALKLIANVTYGYTSASFSGRMPCSEIADSIVQTGRETLEKAIALIHSRDKWGAEVVYGDTDSLFVYLKGRTREQAFDIGEEIADTITNMNPRPVKLKFEKVYHPCVLLAKKRYVGFKYEHRNQKEPEFDAKGIETVRRDGTPAEQKIEEKALKILFKTADLSQVKSFFQSQCTKIMKGKVSIQDFCFAREVKLGTYSDKGPPPPGALISARRMVEDPRLEPQYGERVPYVVITGGPGARLIDRCVAPEVLLQDAQLELDAEYYISKNLIPPLERIFNLVGANVRQWYDEMPKFQRIRRVEGVTVADGRDAVARKTLESYMKSSTCIVCRESLDGDSPVCSSCFEQSPHTALVLRARITKAERKAAQLHEICRSCSGLAWMEEVKCDSKDCPVFYSRTRQMADMSNTKAHIGPVLRLLEEREEPRLDW